MLEYLGPHLVRCSEGHGGLCANGSMEADRAAKLLQYRLNYSKQLLLDSGQSIQEIAAACRFADAFAFSKAFRRYYGLSPSQFRKNFSHFV
ncbi:MAG TPA: helix-turn-helix transcriptional regulator [Candidatus Caccousia stercoris]|uniref:Helix-turn-helix transcriptional regulator n=2 Tax=Eubacteriales TaxID=186802 RepID=A0A9D1FTF9_9FIRM|nr:hypothetical protein B5F35_06430 [Anaeromassilibacillus sp. An200]HIS78945.1 helix-turn-helix transcriptional regulator [Candidatus Caccousia stercoris]